MRWFINDLSLNTQYSTPEEFSSDLRRLLDLRYKRTELTKNLLCTREILSRPVTHNYNLSQTLYAIKDQNLRALALSWITRSGPFWDENRQIVENDYFELENQDITDSGIGEAARHASIGNPSEIVSFPCENFNHSPLIITHGLAEAPLGLYNIENKWDWNELERSILATQPPITSWRQMKTEISKSFEFLSFTTQCTDTLDPQPFSSYAAQRVIELLSVLNEYIRELTPEGTSSDRNHEIIRTHFSGKKAWFSDESDTNKNKFRKELSFISDQRNGERVFCPMHGKIKTPQYRIHFEWPPKGRTSLEILYIGPKITKG